MLSVEYVMIAWGKWQGLCCIHLCGPYEHFNECYGVCADANVWNWSGEKKEKKRKFNLNRYSKGAKKNKRPDLHNDQTQNVVSYYYAVDPHVCILISKTVKCKRAASNWRSFFSYWMEFQWYDFSHIMPGLKHQYTKFDWLILKVEVVSRV